MSHAKFRTGLGALAALALLQGCSGGSNNPGYWSQYMELLRHSLGGQAITLEQAAKIPYATLAYRFNDGGEAMLVLATDTDGEQLWTAASRVVLVTKNGRVYRTIGLPRNRTSMASQGEQDLPPLRAALQAPYRTVRNMDLPDIGIYAVALRCETRTIRPEIVKILGTAIATMRIDERCQSSDLSWQFTDSYWIDRDSGFTWRSVQNLHPQSGSIEIKILRPPE
jgi:hypothetical protein